ncbi:MAG: valine--tRNA ligase [Terriglobia bacterium]
MELDKVYEPRRFEPRWAQWWVESGIYTAKWVPGKPVFSLVIPPPNVTGSLHMGHMLEHTAIDVTIRWHRMRGDVTLWLPGTDHAGIATEMIVARQLAAKGIQYRRDLTREEFEAKVWEWKAESGGTIKRQMIQIGASCDWSRERFTMDPVLSRAVREVFVSLHERGLLYRGEYMVNWCPSCNTAISDLETVHEETAGHLWHIRYGDVVVATTRPETMLGDTAVAVNPNDDRYDGLTFVPLPLSDRKIPVVRDEIANVEFGTGVVKITPAHDPNDFEVGKRHNLPLIQVIGQDGKITAAGGKYVGLDRYEARKQIVEDLQALGLIEKIDDHTLSIGKCQRCRTVVEPLVSKQWFVRTKPLAAKAIAAVDEKRIDIKPENWIKTWNEWMLNIRDWCVSRQLWWGHRIPAWYCDACNEVVIAREDPAECPKCKGALRQDSDVLDTWFSSGLWPFSTLGWPEQTDDLKHFYPTSLLITGFDIIFFWVARMSMLGIEFMGEVPFHKVYIHGLVRDADKQKMSKTKGNVIDPLVVNDQYGTDAVRMALVSGAAPGTDIVFTPDRLESARNFANKIWNAARFLLMKAGQEAPAQTAQAITLEDRWIQSRINECAREMNLAIDQFRYHEAAQTIRHFIWDDFCDWYIELKKISNDWGNIIPVFETALRLLHPVMPFLTEELWHRLGAAETDSISLQPYPQFDPALADTGAEREIKLLRDIVTAARNLRAELGIDPKLPLTGTISRDVDAALIERLCGVAFAKGEVPKSGAVRSTPDFDLWIDVPAGQMELQRKRLEKEKDQLIKNIASSKRQLGDEIFLSKAPAKILDSMRAKLADYETQLANVDQALTGQSPGQ